MSEPTTEAPSRLSLAGIALAVAVAVNATIYAGTGPDFDNRNLAGVLLGLGLIACLMTWQWSRAIRRYEILDAERSMAEVATQPIALITPAMLRQRGGKHRARRA